MRERYRRHVRRESPDEIIRRVGAAARARNEISYDTVNRDCRRKYPAIKDALIKSIRNLNNRENPPSPDDGWC